jgi:hypothetical protein
MHCWTMRHQLPSAGTCGGTLQLWDTVNDGPETSIRAPGNGVRDNDVFRPSRLSHCDGESRRKDRLALTGPEPVCNAP